MKMTEFVAELGKRGIEIKDYHTLDLLWNYMHRVLETNKKFNLTAITDEDAFVEKMLFDSALVLINQKFEDTEILDIGSGAGFPSVVVSILSPMAHVIALDSTAKKCNFVQEFSDENTLNLETVCARAEDYAKENRDRFMVITARAVASLRILVELAAPMLKVGGVLIAMKGPGFEEEIEQARCALRKLNCEVDYIYEDQLPESKEIRSLVYVKKIGETPKKYPRTFGTIKKNPL